jgi:branched-chain amino acid transport system substrate-binding protein
MLRAAQLAVADANADGGVLGKHIEVVAIDDKADPKIAEQVANDAIDQGIFAVIGPYNSSVGVENLDDYIDANVVVIHLTSNSATNGQGVTVQPKDYQVAPVEAAAITGYFKAKSVAILFDPSTYTEGIASQLRKSLRKDDIAITTYVSVQPDRKKYAGLVKAVVATHPDLIYSSTYYPQGGRIAKALHDSHVGATCLMGLANQDPGFVGVSGPEPARACSFSGVPAPGQFPAAANYVTDYTERFHAQPGTWGTFTYDSVALLFDAVKQVGSWDATAVDAELARTHDYAGLTGSISIDPDTGNRADIPVVILDVDGDGNYAIDPRWADYAGFAR